MQPCLCLGSHASRNEICVHACIHVCALERMQAGMNSACMHAHMHVWNACKPEWPTGERGAGEQPSSRLSCEKRVELCVSNSMPDGLPGEESQSAECMHAERAETHVNATSSSLGAHTVTRTSGEVPSRIWTAWARGAFSRPAWRRAQLHTRWCHEAAVGVTGRRDHSDTADRSDHDTKQHVRVLASQPPIYPGVLPSPPVSGLGPPGVRAFRLRAQPCWFGGRCLTAWHACGC